MDRININGSSSPQNTPQPQVPQEPKLANKPKAPKRSQGKELLSFFSVLILAPVIAILLTMFVFQSYKVDGESMERTLFNNDRLIVWKAGKTWSSITNNDFVPNRYAIVVFNLKTTSAVSPSEDKQLIKRVIGLPGDRVVVSDGIVTIYNKENPEGFLPDRVGPEAGVIRTTSGNIDYTVKTGELFVMGDNRGNSYDSRNFGAIKSSDVVGTLAVRIYPFNEVEKFSE